MTSFSFTRRALLQSALPLAAQSSPDPLSANEWAGLINSYSEAPRLFATDNLISNESGYGDALARLDDKPPTRGGVYIGVGPDQNFSYMARILPAYAFLVDVRRDNLLQHLLFRALFEQSPHRTAFLARWIGREVPAEGPGWPAIIRQLEKSPALPDPGTASLLATIAALPIETSAADRDTIARFHKEFITEGLALRFHPHNLEPNPYYPALRDLLLAKTFKGEYASYLATEERYQALRRLHLENRVIPLVGNLAGGRAVRAIGDFARAHQTVVSCFYVSNVEQYLQREFPVYLQNIASLPTAPHSRLIRSVFGPWMIQEGRENYSFEIVQPLKDFQQLVAKRQIRFYDDILRVARMNLR